MPVPPKDPKIRQRTNRDVTAATLIESSPLGEGVPGLLPRNDGEDWHPEAEALWNDIWTSPMATEYTQADSHRIRLYVDIFHRLTLDFRATLAAELRLQGVCLGLTPIDRRRLQWEIKRADDGKKKAPERQERKGNPITALKAV